MSDYSSLFHTPEFTEADFQKISRLVYEKSGIHLTDSKKELVKARLGKRLRRGRFKSFAEYYRHVVNDPTGQEIVLLLDSISTNFTQFFREPQHFDYLQEQVLPALRLRGGRHRRKVRIWSAGCSSGEEPYSIAITLLETLTPLSEWQIQILATDISTKVLAEAQKGIYLWEKVAHLPMPLLKKYFLKGEGRWASHVQVKAEVKGLVRFQRLNLMEPFAFPEPYDCIFCRNVMIYFDKKTREDLINRLYDCLEPGGVLFIGHSESLTGMRSLFHYIKPAVYKK
jgi:chemotaxis protein methyltransferase CheR